MICLEVQYQQKLWIALSKKRRLYKQWVYVRARNLRKPLFTYCYCQNLQLKKSDIANTWTQLLALKLTSNWYSPGEIIRFFLNNSIAYIYQKKGKVFLIYLWRFFLSLRSLSKSSRYLRYTIRKGIPIDILRNLGEKENRINQEPTCVKSEPLPFPFSETEPLGEDPSSEPSGTGDGGCWGGRYSTLNLLSSTTWPASLLN